MTPIERRARALIDELDGLSDPGAGSTAARWLRLADVGAEDLSVARLVEPHLDAVAILHEANGEPEAGCLYAVWASRSTHPVTVRPLGDGAAQLVGTQPFGGGASICDRALIDVVAVVDAPFDTASDSTAIGTILVDVDLRTGRRDGTILIDTSRWRSPAFVDTATGEVAFDRYRLSVAAQIGDAGFYLRRPGFWHGAVGPAAVWCGGVAGLLAEAERAPIRTAHERAGLGELRAMVWGMQAQLRVAGDEADAAPNDATAARERAVMIRHLIERQCVLALDVFTRTVGPRLLVHDDAVIRRVQELQLYLRQVHYGADLESITEGGASS